MSESRRRAEGGTSPLLVSEGGVGPLENKVGESMNPKGAPKEGFLKMN